MKLEAFHFLRIHELGSVEKQYKIDISKESFIRIITQFIK